MTVECPQCGDEFERIGGHWSLSSNCSYPKLTQKQTEATIGLLMGDGCISKQKGTNPLLYSKMTNRAYLQYIDETFDILGCGVDLKTTAKENAQKSRNTGFNPNAKVENYSDVYEWYSRRHPEFEKFADWYSTGEKVWPEDIKLTPTVLKHWYCGDGCWDNNSTHNRITIGVSNEVENTEKLDKMFEKASLPQPNNYSIYQKGNNKDCIAQFTVEQSKEPWEYMGEPLPGFGYKWPEKYRS